MLSVQDLRTSFLTPGGEVKAVDGVSFDLPRGKTLCLVGESGCGKSVTALSIMRLVPSPPGINRGGRIVFGDGAEAPDLLTLSDERMRQVRGGRIAMIFQEPMTSLNPVFTVGDQIAEALMIHKRVPNKKAALERARELIDRVGIPDSARRVRAYPHEMSGGMRQRIMIAMAISCEPEILIADEPTTALDVTIQAQILAIIGRLKEERGMSTLFITHDLGVVAEMADEVAVMYAGRIVEKAPAMSLFDHPRHPYTVGLMESLPRLDQTGRLKTIPGSLPDLKSLPAGCRFADRCPHAEEKCRSTPQQLAEVAPGHWAACWKQPYAAR